MKEKNTQRLFIIGLAISTCTLLLLTIFGMIYFQKQIKRVTNDMDEEITKYQNHYAFIVCDDNKNFWNAVYEGAFSYGKGAGVYVELFGADLYDSYTTEELMEMAIAAKVDGIILYANELDAISEQIASADTNCIPVVTVLNDTYGSERISFVGVSSYHLGRTYAREIIKTATPKTKNVLLLIDKSNNDTSQILILNGLSDTLSNEGNHLNLNITTLSINSLSTFSIQETMRDIFVNKEEIPDIILCLNEKATTSVYQAIVDYNKVGEVVIIGYYTSEAILKAIDKGSIFSTITVDTTLLGEECVKTLNEYLETGYVNDYVTLEVDVISKHNVKEYLDERD